MARSHWVGLNVHDPGSYGLPDGTRSCRALHARPTTLLEPGMVFTVEPGIYIPEAATPRQTLVEHRRSHRGRNPGHGTGGECLSCGAPREAVELEKAITPKASVGK